MRNLKGVSLIHSALCVILFSPHSDNNDFCDVHLINTGVTINEDRTATFTFEGTGPSEITDFRCSDFITSGRQNFVDCKLILRQAGELKKRSVTAVLMLGSCPLYLSCNCILGE